MKNKNKLWLRYNVIHHIFICKIGDGIIKIKHDECQPGRMVKNSKFEKY